MRRAAFVRIVFRINFKSRAANDIAARLFYLPEPMRDLRKKREEYGALRNFLFYCTLHFIQNMV